MHNTDPCAALIHASQSFQARSIKINAVPPQQINIDGEVRGSTPIVIDVKARTLRVLIR
jgi:diacylglycerol kinase family enzyme